jgi:hypothetical protein
MNESIRDILRIAAATGELVSIIYSGGSQPGTVREIRVISINANDMRAHDIAIGVDKSYSLSKVEIAKRGAVVLTYDPNFRPAEDTRTIKEALASKVAELEAAGWNVELTQNAIYLREHFKNGKVRKSAVMGLTFNEFVTDIAIDDEDWSKLVQESRKSKRPYHVVGPTYKGGAGFAKLSGAIEAFMEQVRKHPPGIRYP